MDFKKELTSKEKVGLANDFGAIRISIASPEEIRSWSYGEVKKHKLSNF